ncbi:MAG: Acyltransferase family protein [Herminiimonas sp.]|nr:Acyltransferase family protein [Herminiimonas sp.]
MINSYIDPDVKNRISILRFVMIFGIVVLHTPTYVNIANVGSGWFDLTKAFFQSAVFRCTVPMLTCISGYLLFRSGLDRDFRKLWLKKCRTLLIPFLVCNSLLALFVYIIQAEAKLPMSYQLYPFNLGTMLDAAFGLTTSPVNYPLNFVRDLFILMILAPLFGLVLRRSPFAGLVLVVPVFWFNIDGFLIVRNEMPIMFYIGGMAAVQNWNIKRLDRYAGLCLVLFLALCVSVIYFKATNTTYIRFVAPILLWPASALFSDTKAGYWLARKSRYSFFIFLLHAPLLMVSFVLYKQLAPHVPYALYWFLTPVAVTCFLITAYKLGMAYTSVSFTRVFGARTA